MDADILRLILFLAGVGLILGIYFWDRHKKVNAKVHAIRRAQREQADTSSPVKAKRVDPSWDGHAVTGETVDDWSHPAEEEDGLEAELQRLDLLAREDKQPAPAEEQQATFSFTADDTDDFDALDQANVPTMILQINVVASRQPFTGEQIVRVTRELDLVHGDMNIYHRFASDGPSPRVVFSMASMVEPGIFLLEKMDQFSTPGLLLFGQLPGPKEGLAAFSDMLFTAERLAALLDGELQDETHSALSKQTIEHIRGRILEHSRQVRLALSRP